jgi:hypothetical protein
VRSAWALLGDGVSSTAHAWASAARRWVDSGVLVQLGDLAIRTGESPVEDGRDVAALRNAGRRGSDGRAGCHIARCAWAVSDGGWQSDRHGTRCRADGVGGGGGALSGRTCSESRHGGSTFDHCVEISRQRLVGEVGRKGRSEPEGVEETKDQL